MVTFIWQPVDQIQTVYNIYLKQKAKHQMKFAILSGDYTNTKRLLLNGALPNHRDSEGNTPIHLAVGCKNLTLVRLLD